MTDNQHIAWIFVKLCERRSAAQANIDFLKFKSTCLRTCMQILTKHFRKVNRKLFVWFINIRNSEWNITHFTYWSILLETATLVEKWMIYKPRRHFIRHISRRKINPTSSLLWITEYLYRCSIISVLNNWSIVTNYFSSITS